MGAHSLQDFDFDVHMDAGIGKSWWAFLNSSHGMKGILVSAKDVDGTVKSVYVDNLYDDVLWDYTASEGWHKHLTREENSRWINSRERTKSYFYEFLLYGYGPGK